MTRAAILRRSLAVATLLLLAAAIRLQGITGQSLWFDEGWSAHAAIQPTLAQAVRADETNPPLYYLLLNLGARFLGDSEFSLRWPSALMTLLLNALVWQLARCNFGRRVAWYALWLATCSAPLWWAAREARMYALLALLVLALLLAWQQLLRRPGRRAWLLLLSCETLILYTHNTGPLFILWLNLVALLHWLRTRRRPRQPGWRAWLAGQLTVLVLWMPWLLTRYLDVAAANSALQHGPQPGLTLFSRMWASLLLAPWELVVASGLTGLVGVVAAAFLPFAPWQRAETRRLLLYILLPALLLIPGLGLIGNPMHGRYLLPLAPLLCVLLAAAIDGLPGRARRLVAALLPTLLLTGNLQLAADPALRHDDARGMAQYYARTLTAQDSVLAWSYAERYELAYYWRRMQLPARLITLPEGAGLQQIAPLLPRQGRVALNQWYTQRADYRGMAPCLLGHGTTRPPAAYTVYGMRNLLHDAPPSGLPRLQPAVTAVSVDGAQRATLHAHGALPPQRADQALCLPVVIRAGPQLNSEVQAALLLLNSLGQVVTQRSAIFASDDQQTGAQASPGALLSAWPLLWLPYGAAPGEYEVRLRVFDETQAPGGHELRDANGAPIGRELLLGLWRITPGADWRSTGRETTLTQHPPLELDGGLRLLAHDLAGVSLVPGQTRALNLLWEGGGNLPDLTLAASDGSWERRLAPAPGERDSVTLDWREVTVPASARAGGASLLLPDGMVLARWLVGELPRLDTPPDYATPVGRRLGDVGTLLGYTLADTAPTRAVPLEVTLVWQAGPAAPATSYTVFVQLLNAQGHLIAQSDALPVAGARPTSGWRSGEYLVDVHRLQFNSAAQPGPVRLIAGLYDARSGERLAQWPGGVDHLALPGEIQLR